MRQLSLKQFVSDQCANWINGGICLGINFQSPPGGEIVQVTDGEMADKPCKIPKERCQYFENCLIPLVPSHPEYDEAAREYYLMTDEFRKALPKVRKCACGNPIARRRRICDDCSRNNRLNNWRNRKKKCQ